jgi:trehalose monomycolate/heme transporter
MKLLGNDCWWAPRWMKRLQERIGLGEITPEDERKASEPAPEQLDESLAFGTVLGAPTWRKPPHDPSRPTAAALATSGAASAVALADPPSTDPTMPPPATGGGGDDDVAPAERPSDTEESTADETEDVDGPEASDGEDETAADDTADEDADEDAVEDDVDERAVDETAAEDPAEDVETSSDGATGDDSAKE